MREMSDEDRAKMAAVATSGLFIPHRLGLAMALAAASHRAELARRREAELAGVDIAPSPDAPPLYPTRQQRRAALRQAAKDARRASKGGAR